MIVMAVRKPEFFRGQILPVQAPASEKESVR